MGTPTFLNRMRKELADLERDPPPLVNCYPSEDDMTQLEAYLNGPPNTPYEKGIFRLDVNMPENYPFDPPMIRFRTPIYHPNIDECGRICASVLKKGKDDQWKPSMNLRTTLLSLHALIGEPNPDDPLDADIAREYQQDYDLFVKKAREHTKKYAVDSPDNLIPDPYTDSTTHLAKTTDMNLDNYPNDSGHILSTGVDDTSVATSSSSSNKSKSKSKLSLSRKKRSDTQSIASSSSSQYSIENGMKSTTIEESDTNSLLTLHQKEVSSTSQQTSYKGEVSSCSKGDGGRKQQTLINKHENEPNDENRDVMEHPSLNGLKVGLRNKITKHENGRNSDKCDYVEQPTLDNHEDGSRNKNDKHEKESYDDTCHDMEQISLGSSHEGGPRDKDTKHEYVSNKKQGDTEYGTHNTDQEYQANDSGNTAKQVIYIDLDDEPNDREQLIHDKTTYTVSDESDESDECDDVEQQTPIDVGDRSNDREELIHDKTTDTVSDECDIVERQSPIGVESSPSEKSDGVDHVNQENGIDGSCKSAADLCQLTSPTDKVPDATSVIVTNETPAAAVVATAPLPLTPSTGKAPSPSSSDIILDSSGHSTEAIQPPPVTKNAVNDISNLAYTNHYSSHYLAFTTNDLFADVFPTIEEEEERPSTPKRKSKLSLSCKKKPKTA